MNILPNDLRPQMAIYWVIFLQGLLCFAGEMKMIGLKATLDGFTFNLNSTAECWLMLLVTQSSLASGYVDYRFF
jgi:hypothetical protein